MKKKHVILDVDYIGGMGPLTEEDAKEISAFIQESKRKRKELEAKLEVKKSKRTIRKKVS